MSDLITQDMLKSILEYNSMTGEFYWKNSMFKKHKDGVRAGSESHHGYRKIGIKHKKYYEHRLAWIWFYGVQPKYKIDHIDGNTRNNSIGNLRDIQHSINLENQRKSHKDSKSGLLGASYNKNYDNWSSMIWVGGRSIFLGNFDTPEEAHEVYLREKRRLHIGCTI